VTSRRAVGPALLRYGRSFGVGAAFAVGWTPCIGPILGAIFTLAYESGTVAHGAFLLVFWSLGLGIPYLITGFALGGVMKAIRKVRPAMPVIELVGGAIVVVVGVLIFLDEFTIFNEFFVGMASTVTDAEDGVDGISITGPLGFAAAFLAGVVAFLSPCNLPLVPAYVAHLAGVSGETDDLSAQRGVTFRHAVAFVLGFSALFIFLGASVGALGFFVRDNLGTLEKVAGVLLIVMGLNLMRVINIPWLYRTYQVELPGSPSSRPVS
jgi:cytochrome c biogenesis protein CcdA